MDFIINRIVKDQLFNGILKNFSVAVHIQDKTNLFINKLMVDGLKHYITENIFQ
jgi:hypothetical protein